MPRIRTRATFVGSRPRASVSPRTSGASPRGTLGTVYLLHFARPLKGIQHYVGWTENLPRRIRQHSTGEGSITTRLFANARIPFAVACLWHDAPLSFESAMISRVRHTAEEYCPICADEYDYDRGLAELEAVGLVSDSEWLQ